MTFNLVVASRMQPGATGLVKAHVKTHEAPRVGERVAFDGTEYEVLAIVHNAVRESEGAFAVPTVYVSAVENYIRSATT